MSLEKLVQILQDAYAFFDQLNVSSSFLIALAALFGLASLLALREAAAWFFKVEDIKRDIARLQEIALQLEGEIRSAQNLIQQSQARPLPAGEPAFRLSLGTEPTTPDAATDQKTTSSFPISH